MLMIYYVGLIVVDMNLRRVLQIEELNIRFEYDIVMMRWYIVDKKLSKRRYQLCLLNFRVFNYLHCILDFRIAYLLTELLAH